MNNLATDKKIVISIIAILFVTVSFLFLKGEISLQKATQGYDIIAFENTIQKINSQNISETLSFYIQNLEKKEMTYEINFLINNQLISQITENVKSNKRKTIQPTQEIINQIKNDNLESFEYKVVINKDNESKVIYKQIKK